MLSNKNAILPDKKIAKKARTVVGRVLLSAVLLNHCGANIQNTKPGIRAKTESLLKKLKPGIS